MAMYELTLIRNVPPKEENPGWVDMMHLAIDCDSIEEWTAEYAKTMNKDYPHILFTFITHYEEFNSPETYRHPEAIGMDHIS